MLYFTHGPTVKRIKASTIYQDIINNQRKTYVKTISEQKNPEKLNGTILIKILI